MKVLIKHEIILALLLGKTETVTKTCDKQSDLFGSAFLQTELEKIHILYWQFQFINLQCIHPA